MKQIKWSDDSWEWCDFRRTARLVLGVSALGGLFAFMTHDFTLWAIFTVGIVITVWILN